MRNCACATPWVAKMVYVPVLDELSFEELLRDLRRVLRLARASETSGGVVTRPVKRFIKRLKVIRRHVENGDFQRARFEASAALRSYHASVAAVLAVHKGLGTLSSDEVHVRAVETNPLKPCNDTVIVHVVPKLNGGHRLVYRFGWRHRARQWLLRAVLIAYGVGNEFEGNARGLGVPRVIEAMRIHVEQGRRYWAIADIKNFYSTVKPSHLRGLTPIAFQKLSSVMFIPYSVPIKLMKDGHTINHSHLEKEARRGLPQGSLLSPLLASALLGRELMAIAPSDNPVVSVVDDIAMGARTEEEATEFLESLSQRLASLGAAPLQLKHARVYDAHKGIIALGQKIRLVSNAGRLEARVTLAPQSYNRMEIRAFERFGDELHELAYDDEPNALDDYLCNALRGYGLKPAARTIYAIKLRMFVNQIGIGGWM